MWVYAKSSALSVEIELGSTRPVAALEAWSSAPVCSSFGCHLRRGIALEVKNFRRRVKRENTFICIIKRSILLSVRTTIWKKANTRLQTVFVKTYEICSENIFMMLAFSRQCHAVASTPDDVAFLYVRRHGPPLFEHVHRMLALRVSIS